MSSVLGVSLPLEMFWEIFEYLNVADFRNFRLVCKDFYELYKTYKPKLCTKKISQMMIKDNVKKCLRWASYYNNSSMIEYIIQKAEYFDINDIFYGFAKQKQMDRDKLVELHKKYASKSKKELNLEGKMILYAIEKKLPW